MQHRVQQAKKAEPKWDRGGVYAQRCAELASAHGLDTAEVYEEFCERSSVRVYLGELTVEDAERLAFEDVLARFEVRQ